MAWEPDEADCTAFEQLHESVEKFCLRQMDNHPRVDEGMVMAVLVRVAAVIAEHGDVTKEQFLIGAAHAYEAVSATAQA
mgnify:CR=1 FL=1